MGKPSKFHIPKPPKVEPPLTIRREDVKVRKTWNMNPVEQVVPNKKKNQDNYKKCSNKGNLKKQIERELHDFDEETQDN